MGLFLTGFLCGLGEMMTVNDLIKQLQAMPEEDRERVLIVQKDGEGNGYSPLSDVYESWYIPDSTWSGECPHPDDVRDGEVVLGDDAVKAMILVPVN